MDDCLAAARWLLTTDEFTDLPVIVVGRRRCHPCMATSAACRRR